MLKIVSESQDISASTASDLTIKMITNLSLVSGSATLNNFSILRSRPQKLVFGSNM